MNNQTEQKTDRKQKKRHPQKGEHGYFAWEKKKRIAIVALMYGIVLLIYFTGIARYHTRKNAFTLIAILGILPAAKWTVSMIMACIQKPFSEEAYQVTERIAKGLTRGYELCVTAEEGRLALDAVVVTGSQVVAYTRANRGLFEFMQKHIAKILSSNGLYGMNVRIFLDLNRYTERISALAQDPDRYRTNLKNAADAVHEGESRDEAVMRVIRNISI